MPQDVRRYGILDGDYTLDQIQNDVHLSVLLPSAGPIGHLTRVRGGWATRVSATSVADKPAAPASQTSTSEEKVDVDTMSYAQLRSLAKDLGYSGSSRTRKAFEKYIQQLENQ